MPRPAISPPSGLWSSPVPNLAREIAERQPSASVVASVSLATAEAFQAVCHTARFRAYTNTDVIGCELGGATKNVIALAVGMAMGLGLGANATASVITRGLAEISRLGLALGADPYTFSGLAGLGDLVATCSSPLSRNRTFGEELGKGRTVAEITASTRQVAEGVKSCASITELAAKHQIEMPIVENVAAVIAGELSPADAALMSPQTERYYDDGRLLADSRSGLLHGDALMFANEGGNRWACQSAMDNTAIEGLSKVSPEVLDMFDPQPTSAPGLPVPTGVRLPSVAVAPAWIRLRRGWWQTPRASSHRRTPRPSSRPEDRLRSASQSQTWCAARARDQDRWVVRGTALAARSDVRASRSARTWALAWACARRNGRVRKPRSAR